MSLSNLSSPLIIHSRRLDRYQLFMAKSPQPPIIDLGDRGDPSRRSAIVDAVREASERWGMFQVVNHGIPMATLQNMLQAACIFHEVDDDKARLPLPTPARPVAYLSNLGANNANRPGWKNTLTVEMAPEPPLPEDLPSSCRDVLGEYVKHVASLGQILLQFMSEALGLASDHLERLHCLEGLRLSAHYYPPCLDLNINLGTTHHSDPCFFTVLLQDQIGGLQVLHQGDWVDVPPLEGALVINIGDLLQLLTNDKLKSAVHRVLINRVHSRTSVACLFSSYRSKALHRPIKELLSMNDRSMYREVTTGEYTVHYMTKVKDFTSALVDFRV